MKAMASVSKSTSGLIEQVMMILAGDEDVSLSSDAFESDEESVRNCVDQRVKDLLKVNPKKKHLQREGRKTKSVLGTDSLHLIRDRLSASSWSYDDATVESDYESDDESIDLIHARKESQIKKGDRDLMDQLVDNLLNKSRKRSQSRKEQRDRCSMLEKDSLHLSRKRLVTNKESDQCSYEFWDDDFADDIPLNSRPEIDGFSKDEETLVPAL